MNIHASPSLMGVERSEYHFTYRSGGEGGNDGCGVKDNDGGVEMGNDGSGAMGNDGDKEMGGHNRSAKPSTVEVLEKMEKEIQSLEEFQDKNQKLRKIWVGRLLLYSVLLYLLTCFIVYLWYLPNGLTARLLIIIPFLLFPVIIWFTRTLLIIWFSKRTERNNDALEDLKAQKKKIAVNLA
ncbi:unnamed protein product [Ranitomeya imitator]|uniref:Uncharacterized protein n=1 Tax=Ranitomeya imitator TaxID=111125 RepID=A0ABN9L9I6_9NEOB|nr:unnamed protein product [Ranitomeya imitator]